MVPQVDDGGPRSSTATPRRRVGAEPLPPLAQSSSSTFAETEESRAVAKASSACAAGMTWVMTSS